VDIFSFSMATSVNPFARPSTRTDPTDDSGVTTLSQHASEGRNEDVSHVPMTDISVEL